ncbi:MAG: asparagine synthase (glutamine-hydrolyzing) [Methylobacteriaceae bacterium]|jgi:asparagine synthase (glutamine-hydrolysing)|nr:asparagine synthase (glutamine-hydrolyzing) [Methylobacteriaceae bacterium]
MCGILGVLSFNSSPKPLDQRDLAVFAHRGPDSVGVFHDDNVSLGHTRLAILELSELGAQPMTSADGRYVIVFNGEIYNFKELQEDLRRAGRGFRSNSDTEVILEAFAVWGRDCVKRFRGMFAFALWDTVKKQLFLARDKCGERPLLYACQNGSLYFASEMKALIALLPETPCLNPAAVDLFLHYQYTPEPQSLLNGIMKLPAAHTLLISGQDFDARPQRYWNVEERRPLNGIPAGREAILKYIAEKLEESVRLTLVADVPVAVALSGGIDSGAIAALAQKNYPEPMHAFSIGYPGRPPYDEREQAKGLAEKLGLIFHEVELPVDDFIGFFPEMVDILDEPVADPAAFGHYTVPKTARSLGIKVLLTGIGGDEIFWGYDWIAKAAGVNQRFESYPRWLRTWARTGTVRRAQRSLAACNRLPAAWRRLAECSDEAWDDTPAGEYKLFDMIPDFRYARTVRSLFYGEAMTGLDPLNAYTPVRIGARQRDEIPAAMIRLLFDTWLTGNCLTLGDRVSMASSVESRLPFLEPGLVEAVMSVRERFPDHELGQKHLLRKALKGILPDEVLTRPKSGFRPPVEQWLGGVVDAYADVYLKDDNPLITQGLFRAAALKEFATAPNKPFPQLFMAYKLVLLAAWCMQVVNRQKL